MMLPRKQLVLIATFIAMVDVCPLQAQSYHPGPVPGDTTDFQRIFKNGRKDALRDIEHGQFIIKWYGLPMLWDAEFAAEAQSQLGVIIEFGPDVVMPIEDAYSQGYNSEVYRVLNQRFGKNALDTLYHAVVASWYRVRPGQQPLNPEILQEAQYTTAARQQRIEGRVFLRFDISPRGIPENIKVIRGLGFGLDEEAMRVINLLRFPPAEDQKHGKPLTGFTAPVRFEPPENQ